MLTIEGNIVNIEKVFRGRIEIDQNGMINKIGEPTGDADFIFKDELIFPGFVDLHVHARECADHSQDYKEDFMSAGQAAINGGVVAFMEMPNNPIPPIDDKSYIDKKKLTEKSETEVVLYAGIGENTKPLKNPVPYKVFMGPSVGSLFFHTLEELENVLAQYHGCSISFHCENPEILDENKNKITHEERRSPKAEISAIDFALRMIEKYNLSGKICHSSTKEGIEKIKNAKMRKLNVVAEVSPHHLYFDREMLTEDNQNWMQMNPPLRASADRIYLTEALRDGVIDFLATDHAPHTKEEKSKGISGTSQLDTYGPFVAWLMKEKNFTPQDIARVSSENPGNFFNQFSKHKYGKIEKGYVGSFTVLDLNKPIKVTKDMLKTKCGWSPFEGVTFPGSIIMTIIKGKIYAK
ncbi:amidohydrolase [Candidatus Nomurabacteria bacterium RIFCSPHIGHO2_01_FULL_37_25]|uniref:Amidohydrolase n=1 Tax=Candidatus Nomurabacteria bacterium RIFCSPLOWO2_01_FULL_36_16 TaxID=1801767 RepID=A0A1F6X099_9BACT|nr:MAG: amidohydrolase [Candidatus Nomurabacteria bacterium RIFCSPHIGHO2_01_FULL_37_25]OGI75923.1 MAG: amidohydrolase [Candidatus Nomurabacteria bacterium RIFCSPHIGHO2_02_FULL_36_29]OGI87454.1 MAG: amidohydrolase [Candidatus Nomurabacteria bacterium RIFCSPLOWO2_01_FULL_36_16]